MSPELYYNYGTDYRSQNDSFRIGDHVIPISRSYNRVAHEKYDEYLRFQQECNGEETE